MGDMANHPLKPETRRDRRVRCFMSNLVGRQWSIDAEDLGELPDFQIDPFRALFHLHVGA